MVTDPLVAPLHEPRLPPGRRVYAVGDMHGHLDRLRSLHALIRADLAAHPVKAPLLVHLGDYIDRGPDSAGCIALLAAGPPLPGVPTVNLMGNHERMMLDALDRQWPGGGEHWLANGGEAALASWGIPFATPPRQWQALVPAAHLLFLRALGRYHVDGGYVFVHAGVRPGVALPQQKLDDLLWIRGGFLDWDGPVLPGNPSRVVVHGHTPVPAPEVRPYRIGCDTGAGKGGTLTCAVLEGDAIRFLQA